MIFVLLDKWLYKCLSVPQGRINLLMATKLDNTVTTLMRFYGGFGCNPVVLIFILNCFTGEDTSVHSNMV